MAALRLIASFIFGALLGLLGLSPFIHWRWWAWLVAFLLMLSFIEWVGKSAR